MQSLINQRVRFRVRSTDPSRCPGFSSPQEYLAWWSRFDIQHVFDQYDADGSGSISVTELQLLCGDLGVTLSRREVRAPAASAP